MNFKSKEIIISKIKAFKLIGWIKNNWSLSKEKFSLKSILNLFSLKPSEVMGIELSEIKSGAEVELTIINPNEKWIFKDTDIHSKSKNTPFLNQEFKGNINFTIHKNILFG